MKYFLWAVLGLIAFIIAMLIVIPSFIDVNNYKQEVSAVVERYTGRKLEIAGDISFSLFPTVSLNIQKVTFANAKWAGDEPMVSVGELQLQVATIPLVFRGEVHVEKFQLIKPEITLTVDKTGRQNWQLDTTKIKNDLNEPAEQQEKAQNTKPQEKGVDDLKKIPFFGSVGIENGTLHYNDQQHGTELDVQEINSAVTLTSVDEPLIFSGSGVWNKQKVSAELQMSNVRSLLTGKEANGSAQISSNLASLSYTGSVTYDKDIATKGKFQAKSADLSKLVAWLDKTGKSNAKLPESQSFSFNTGINFVNKRIGLDGIDMAFGNSSAIGTASVDLAGATPYVKGDLLVSMLDLSPYMQSEQKNQEADQAEKATTTTNAGSSPQAEGWSDAPIDLSGLRGVDADIHIKAEQAIIPPLSIGKTDLVLALKKGKLNADINEMGFYDGSVKGQVVVDASQKTAAIHKRIVLSKVNMQSWLHDMAESDRLSGTLDATVDIQARGNSQKALVGTAQGNGSFFISNGKVKGVDLAKMVRNVASAFTNVTAEQGDTDFSEASGTFVVNQGIVSNNDLDVKAPLLQLTGTGTADMPNKYLDYTVTPKIVGTLKGSQQTSEMGGVTVPVKIQGEFSHLHYKPAAGSIVKDVLSNPGTAKDKLKDLERGVRSIRDSLKLELKGN